MADQWAGVLTKGIQVRNTQLFNAIADHIEARPDLYNQTVWAADNNDCGTTCCVAGWAALLTEGLVPNDRVFGHDSIIQFVPSSKRSFSDVGIEVLGLTEDEGDILFDGAWMDGKDTSHVVRTLRDIANGGDIE